MAQDSIAILSSQYHSLQPQFASYRSTSISLIEKEHMKYVLAPFIQDARVLELACGSGFYTFDLMNWGAKSVVAVDFSPAMIAGAEENRKRCRSSLKQADVKFIVADVTKPITYADTPFDLVFAAWPLEYAPDRNALLDIYRNVSMNLKDGGHFVCVTRAPTNDLRKYTDDLARVRPAGGGGVHVKALHDVDGGLLVRLHGSTNAGDVAFDCIHWRKDVYEAAAREAGLKGILTWSVTCVPDRYLEGNGPGGASIQELQTYATVPDYGILMVAK